MGKITVGKENSTNIDLYYEDHGKGKPVLLIHGYPLNGASWERQAAVLLQNGYRVITYDRRGFGKSSQPTTGYDYDTFAEDLNQLMNKLDLKEVTLVGFSMGTGEVTRYLAKYGSDRVSKAVLISSIPPFLLKTPDNPEGADKSIFEGIMKEIKADRLVYLSKFLYNFYNYDLNAGKRVSEDVFKNSWNVAAAASPEGTLDCVPAWLTDFREDVKKINVPTLIIHGNADRILPIDITGNRLQKLIKDAKYVTIDGGPHAIIWTHADQINGELLNFLKQESPKAAEASR